jgi:hypothetical protein
MYEKKEVPVCIGWGYHALHAGWKAFVHRTRRRKEPSGNSGWRMTAAIAADTAAAAVALFSEAAVFVVPAYHCKLCDAVLTLGCTMMKN